MTSEVFVGERIGSPRLTVEDQWFAALDGRQVLIGAAPSPIHIVGIHRGEGELWIQLAPLQDGDPGVVIRCRPTHTPDAVLDALRVFLASTGSRFGPKTLRLSTQAHNAIV